MIIRWILASGLGLFSFLCIVLNFSIFWRSFSGKTKERVSYVGFWGGIVGVCAIMLMPFGIWSNRLTYVWIPLVLDIGSVPSFLSMPVNFLFRKAR